jgi:thioredoxin reductase/SAM-dependent methyltransferase
MTTQKHSPRDVLIIGGGAAGLGGALGLARARRSVLVIDEGRPRNAPAGHLHAYLGRDGLPPAQLLSEGRAEVAGYGGEFAEGTVVSAERLATGGFRVVLDDGSAHEGRRLLVTTGLADELLPVPGLAERWGKDVLHCPYCHGWEVRDEPIGVLNTGPLAVHQALLWRQWSADVTLFRHTASEPLGEEDTERLAARGIAVVEAEVARLDVADDRLTGVVLAGGRTVPCRALAVAPFFAARAGFLAGLGLEPADQEMAGHVVGTHIPTDPTGATEVPGVWAAGNVANVGEQLIGSASAGLRAAAAINMDLVTEDTRQAVTARYWDGRYAAGERMWSGEPNDVLVREIAGLSPGRALELGCGEGADAVWLADRGWQVTAVDVSEVALRRAAAHAEEAGVADRIDWQRHDLAVSFPAGTFDLVSAHFLHSPGDLPREEILRTAAGAVAPGGVLLIVGHAGPPPWEENPHPEVHLPTTKEVLDALDLPTGAWEVQVSGEHKRTQTGPDGEPVTRTDNALRLRRLPV